MVLAATTPDVLAVLLAFGINLLAIFVFAVLIYFRRHGSPGLTVAFGFFNIGLFAIVTVIGRSPVSASVGFGLFAMLSIIRLRSDPFSHREIGYFFGALVLGLVNGMGPPDLFTLALNIVVVGAMYVLDHPALFRVDPNVRITFDRVLTRPDELRVALEDRLGCRVGEVTVCSVDYVHDLMELKVRCVVEDGANRRNAIFADTDFLGHSGALDAPESPDDQDHDEPGDRRRPVIERIGARLSAWLP